MPNVFLCREEKRDPLFDGLQYRKNATHDIFICNTEKFLVNRDFHNFQINRILSVILWIF